MNLLKIFTPHKDLKRKSHVKNLIEVALADGYLADEEWRLLSKVAMDLGMSHEDIKNIHNNPDGIKFVAPNSYKEKLEQINDLVAVMVVDGDIDSNELSVCKKIALKSDLLPRVVDDMLENAISINR